MKNNLFFSMQKRGLLKEFERYSFMILGCLSYALSLKIFLEPNYIVAGGVSGAASLIHLLTKLPTGVFIVVINSPILIFGYRMMGWKFILRCFITTACLSLATEFWELILPDAEVMREIITSDGVLASLYGGILQGIGIGLFIKYETSSGGTELLGRITHKILPFATIATHVADCRTCVLHPASTTHRQLTAQQLEEAGVAEDLIRFSVGLEDADDLIADIEQALN